METLIDHSASKLGIVVPRKNLFIHAYAKLPIIPYKEIISFPENIWIYYEGKHDDPKTENCLVFAVTKQGAITRAFFMENSYTLFVGSPAEVNGGAMHIYRVVPANHAEVLAEAYAQNRSVELYHKNATEYKDMKILLSTKGG
jgi:hypothetical protein